MRNAQAVVPHGSAPLAGARLALGPAAAHRIGNKPWLRTWLASKANWSRRAAAGPRTQSISGLDLERAVVPEAIENQDEDLEVMAVLGPDQHLAAARAHDTPPAARPGSTRRIAAAASAARASAARASSAPSRLSR